MRSVEQSQQLLQTLQNLSKQPNQSQEKMSILRSLQKSVKAEVQLGQKAQENKPNLSQPDPQNLPPEVQQALGFLDPLNIGTVLEMLGIPGFESTVQDQKVKVLEMVDQLLQGQPMPAPPPPLGQPPLPPAPSIPIDDYDNAAMVSSLMAKWMIGRKGQKAKQENPNGFANVHASWQAYQKAATPPPPAPASAASRRCP